MYDGAVGQQGRPDSVFSVVLITVSSRRDDLGLHVLHEGKSSVSFFWSLSLVPSVSWVSDDIHVVEVGACLGPFSF
jgi:hypothetical protein